MRMYEQHESFTQPSDDGVLVWRYMDFTKLVSLLDTACLFFTRADGFSDPFEGSWPKANIEARNFVPDSVPTEDHEIFKQSIGKMGDVLRKWPKYIALNCWHMNDFESAAMWSIYLKSNDGIAIQTTYAALRDSFTSEHPVYLGLVRYIDYDTQWISAENLLILSHTSERVSNMSVRFEH